MRILSGIFNSIQKYLLPELEEELGELSEKEVEFVRVAESLGLDQFVGVFSWKGVGRKRKQRLSLLKAFIAKAVYGFSNTKTMIENVRGNCVLRRLCGWETKWEVPSEPTFSRAFGEFAESELPQKIHEAIVRRFCDGKIVGHVSRDSTAIEGREKAVRKEKPAVKEPAKKKGRPPKGEEKIKIPRRLELQRGRSFEANAAELPRHCDFGAKYDTNGNLMTWRGYKLHIDTIDGDIPVGVMLTSASLHDSQAAIPMMQMTKERLINLYDLMDSAYDAPEIRQFSESMGHVPVIDFNRRKGEAKQLDPAKKLRYNERTAAERVNSNLKDNYGGSNVRVKGYKKVFAHLMMGILVITVNQIYNMLL